MLHPFASTIRGRIALMVVWMVVMAIHSTVLIFLFNIELTDAIVDSLATNSLWVLLSFGLWYWVRFSDIETGKTLSIAINHAGAAALSVAIQVYISLAFLKYYAQSGSPYSSFIDASTIGRVIYGIAIYLFLALIFYLIIYIQSFREKLLKEGELKSLVKDAELNWLKLQVNPHFLFNSLNSVSTLTISAPEKAQEMIIRLSELLRYSLKQSPSSMVPLEKEIESCIGYLEIEKVRFGSRLAYRFEVAPECMSIRVPGMIIQPLFENAIKHGVAQTPDKTEIIARFTKHLAGLEIEVSNTYPTDPFAVAGTGVGLDNIRRRLKLIYGSESLISTSQTETHFIVTIYIPFVI